MLRGCRCKRAYGVVMSVALSGCAVGPDFKPPAAPATEAYTAERLTDVTEAADVAGGEPQHFQFGRDMPGKWWTLFGSTELDTLIEQAMARYPDLEAQQAALRAARANVRAQEGIFAPQAQGSASRTRERSSGTAIAPGFPGFITNIYQADVNVSYAIDTFGGERRALEGLLGQAEAKRFQLEASYLTLICNVLATAIQLAETHDQIAVTEDIIALNEKQLGITSRRFELGSQTRADVLQQQSNLATVRATLPPLQQQLAVAAHQLAALTGQFPHDASPIRMRLSDLKLPSDLPVSLPSLLVAQRPDIRIQELVMHQASAAIGVADANMLPQLTLTASTGGESPSFSSLLAANSAMWSVFTGLVQPIFQGGTLRARRRAALEAYDQASAQYRLVVLQAFQNVADTLTALANDAQALKAENEAVNVAKASLDLIQKQYDAGAVNSISLLVAQQSYQQACIARLRAVASRYTDTVALFQALGGGWWNRNDSGSVRSMGSIGLSERDSVQTSR